MDYETLNLSALFKLPLLIVVENNLYAVSLKFLTVAHLIITLKKNYSRLWSSDAMADAMVIDILAKSQELLKVLEWTTGCS